MSFCEERKCSSHADGLVVGDGREIFMEFVERTRDSRFSSMAATGTRVPVKNRSAAHYLAIDCDR